MKKNQKRLVEQALQNSKLRQPFVFDYVFDDIRAFIKEQSTQDNSALPSSDIPDAIQLVMLNQLVDGYVAGFRVATDGLNYENAYDNCNTEDILQNYTDDTQIPDRIYEAAIAYSQALVGNGPERDTAYYAQIGFVNGWVRGRKMLVSGEAKTNAESEPLFQAFDELQRSLTFAAMTMIFAHEGAIYNNAPLNYLRTVEHHLPFDVDDIIRYGRISIIDFSTAHMNNLSCSILQIGEEISNKTVALCGHYVDNVVVALVNGIDDIIVMLKNAADELRARDENLFKELSHMIDDVKYVLSQHNRTLSDELILSCIVTSSHNEYDDAPDIAKACVAAFAMSDVITHGWQIDLDDPYQYKIHKKFSTITKESINA